MILKRYTWSTCKELFIIDSVERNMCVHAYACETSFITL